MVFLSVTLYVTVAYVAPACPYRLELPYGPFTRPLHALRPLALDTKFVMS